MLASTHGSPNAFCFVINAFIEFGVFFSLKPEKVNPFVVVLLVLGVHDIQVLGVDDSGKQAGSEIKHRGMLYSYMCAMGTVSKDINPSDPNISADISCIYSHSNTTPSDFKAIIVQPATKSVFTSKFFLMCQMCTETLHETSTPM